MLLASLHEYIYNIAENDEWNAVERYTFALLIVFNKKGFCSMDVDQELEPPDGYHFVATFKYPRRLLYIAKLPPVLLFSGFYLLASWGIVGGDVFPNLARLGVVIVIGILYLTVDIVRGLIQRGICSVLGYDISFYPLFMAPLEPTFAADVGQLQRRRDVLLIAIASLGISLLLAIPLLFGLPIMFTSILAFVWIIYLFGAVWDIYLIAWLLRKAHGTLLYTENLLMLCVFEPNSANETSRASHD